MKNMTKTLKLYLPFSRAGIKGELAYKAQIFMWMFISFCEIFFVLFLYGAIYRNSENGMASVIGGFTYHEMLLYMMTSFLFSFVMGAGDTSYSIYTDIREGTIANTLTKPVSYRLRHLFTYLGVFALDFTIVVLPFGAVIYTVFIALGILEVSAVAFLLRVLFFLVFTVIAGLLNDAIGYFVGMLVFYTNHLFGLNMIRSTLQDFLGGKLIPLSYMGTIGVIFSFTPFAFLNSVPVLVLMGKITMENMFLYLGIALLWLGTIELVNHLIFRHAIHKITVQGG
jgi:ABC-2 type transport system permease protein